MMKTLFSFVLALALLGPAYALACPGHAHGDGEHACACKKEGAEKPCCAKKAEGEPCACGASCEACAAKGEAEGEEKGCGCGKEA